MPQPAPHSEPAWRHLVGHAAIASQPRRRHLVGTGWHCPWVRWSFSPSFSPASRALQPISAADTGDCARRSTWGAARGTMWLGLRASEPPWHLCRAPSVAFVRWRYGEGGVKPTLNQPVVCGRNFVPPRIPREHRPFPVVSHGPHPT